jgi:hypothetical protein
LLANQDAILTGINGLNTGGITIDPEIKAIQLLIIEIQEAVLRGQKETLCALKHNLPSQCAEFVGNGFGNRGKKWRRNKED